MKIPLHWLRDYVDLPGDVDALCEKMTMLGLEIEGFERPGEGIRDVVVGTIQSIEQHPDADRLVVCSTDIGADQPLQIVCGATNMKVGDKVPTAIVGATLPGDFQIGRRKMRGVESQGMMCSAKELGLGEDHTGLLILREDAPVGRDVRPLLGLDDVILEIEVTPNRGDWAGLIGIARELAAAYGAQLRLPEISFTEDTERASDASSVTIENADLCPRYIGRLIRDVAVGPSPDWLSKRLRAAGQRPINNIVDVTNYVLLETGQPLHAFDWAKLREGRIVVRAAKPGERIVTIDQTERTLSPDMLVIADAEEPVAVAGVMGGFDSEVGESTADVFLESAYFDPVSVRRTARALNMITEASQRFQRGADPEMALYAANRACQLIQETAGGRILGGTLDEYPQPFEYNDVELRFHRTNRLLGITVPSETQLKHLNDLGFEIVKQSAEAATLRVPSWRHDVSHEADFIEEIARLHGYDAVPPSIPDVRPTADVYAPEQRVLRAVKEELVAGGLTEVVNWTFMEPADLERLPLPEPFGRTIPLQNPLSEKHAVMRTTLLPGILHTASANLRKNRETVAMFEIGPTYARGAGEEYVQTDRLAIVLAGTALDRHWSHPPRPFDIYDLKGYLEGLIQSRTHTQPAFNPADSSLFKAGASATLSTGTIALGRLGELSAGIAEAFEIERPVYVAEIELTPLLTATETISQYAEVPSHPPSLRDLAVVVDLATPAGALRDTALEAGGKHLKTVEIFDVYRGKPIPDTKKSIALSLTFQSPERTLTDQDTDKAVTKILKALERRFDAQLR